MNALYNPPPDVLVPAIEWLSWEQVVETRDRMLQEFVGYYDPAEYTLVFVLLPSPSGNSVAIWREKVRVPPEARIGRTPDVDLAKAALRKEYPVTVDEWYAPKSFCFLRFTINDLLAGRHPYGPLVLYQQKDHHHRRRRRRVSSVVSSDRCSESSGNFLVTIPPTTSLHVVLLMI